MAPLKATIRSFSVTPLWSAINLTTPGTPEVSPGVIALPGAVYTTFKITANPVFFKNIYVPIRVLSWQWITADGGTAQTFFTGFPVDVERRVYLAEPGRMIVTAFVNGVEQTDTTRVVRREVSLTLEKSNMKFSIEIPDSLPGIIPRHDISRQEVTVSVTHDGVPVPNAVVDLTLIARDGTGGHIHTGGKPAGSLNLTQVNTGPTGTGKAIYTAPQVAGPVTVKGTATSAVTDSAIVDVKIDLVQFGPGVGYELVGGDTYGGAHPKNHFVTATHLAALQNLIAAFGARYTTVLKFNDSSLESGGLFDFNIPTKPWLPGHYGHREGMHTDLHTKPPSGGSGIPLTFKEQLLIRSVWGHNPATGIKLIPHAPPTRHFHLVHP